jgi:ribosomal protein L11 methyltransferase
VLDVGTGSGVLAIAAHKLGASSVVAIDFDADAIVSARECADLNGIADEIHIRQADLEGESHVLGEPFSLVLANLTGGMLVRMAGRLCGLATAGGSLIVSGVTVDEEAAVIEAFQAAGAEIVERVAEGEWAGIWLRRACGN